MRTSLDRWKTVEARSVALVRFVEHLDGRDVPSSPSLPITPSDLAAITPDTVTLPLPQPARLARRTAALAGEQVTPDRPRRRIVRVLRAPARAGASDPCASSPSPLHPTSARLRCAPTAGPARIERGAGDGTASSSAARVNALALGSRRGLCRSSPQGVTPCHTS
jgi:hypothetical protein